MAIYDERSYRRAIADMERHMRSHWDMMARERSFRERAEQLRREQARLGVTIQTDRAGGGASGGDVWIGSGASTWTWVNEAPARYLDAAPAYPELTAALLSELKDMKARLPKGFWHWDIMKSATTADQNNFVYRDRAVRSGLKESPLERRYELARRCWATSRGDFGPGQVRLAQHDGDGLLYEIRGCRSKLLLVSCPSMNKPHVLFVPLTMKTAREARAWTFGLSPEEFDVGRET